MAILTGLNESSRLIIIGDKMKNSIMKARTDMLRNVFKDVFTDGWFDNNWFENRWSSFDPIKAFLDHSPVVSDETETHVYYYVDMPGVRQQNLSVSLTDNVIRVQAERTGRIQSKLDTQFTIPSYVRIESLVAELIDGVLMISLERIKPVETRKSEPRRIEVKTSPTTTTTAQTRN